MGREKKHHDLKEVHSDSFKTKPKEVQFSEAGDIHRVIYLLLGLYRDFTGFIQ